MRASDLSEVQILARKLWPDNPAPDFPGETVFVWEEGDIIGGFASVSVRPWVDGADCEPCPHVESWFVEAALRRRGVGRALVKAIEEWCGQRGYRELTSDTNLDNEASRAAHKAIGFEATEQLQYFKKSLAGSTTGGESGRVTAYAEIGPFHGDRAELRDLFGLADDSAQEIDRYIDEGEVLVARWEGRIIGHVQLTGSRGEREIKSVAVEETHQQRGMGAALVRAAVDRAFAEGAMRVMVATATADIENLRFYQRLGFRMERVQRDVFTDASGYAGLEANGIPVRDQVWFSMQRGEAKWTAPAQGS